MNLSKKWLNDFLDIEVASKELSDAMTMSGSKVEGYKLENEVIDNVVVGEILSINPHPDADKLQICSVNIGKKEPIQIITAAKNMKVGDKVPVALDNSTLADGSKIFKGKLRGIDSFGMFCSLKELGLTIHDFPYAIEDGLFIIEENCKPGDDICEAIGLNDTVFEFEITSNRPDCFSIMGLAREAAATLNKEFKLKIPKINSTEGNAADFLSVEVREPGLCPSYCSRVVKNVKVKPSPRWMRERLRAMGVRPINNIVDITNYVMLEYGQPMHAFDLNFIKDGKIIVRRAADNESITTLDGVERTLNSNQLVIANSEKPMAIAGVMGGEFSGITNDTTTIVFESANFNPASVRITARDQGMRTDASARYEKGLDPNNCMPALDRACELIELLGAGEVLAKEIAVQNFSPEKRRIPLEVDFINNFININLSEAQMKEILLKLGCEFENNDILVPTYRPDLVHKADIAEEIARFYGYNNIKTTSLRGSARGKYTKKQKFDRLVKNTMQTLGFDEIMTYSFISPKAYDKILMPKDASLRNSVKISNPLGEDTSIMRTTAIPSILEALAKNYSNRNLDVKLFELAKEYVPTEPNKLPFEKDKLIAGVYGNNVDFFDIKGAAESVLSVLSIDNYNIEASDKYYSFHPGRCAEFSVNGKIIGVLGEVHPTVCENYGIQTRVYILDFDIDTLFNNYNTDKVYKALPKFPAVTRDISFICSDEIPVLKLKNTISSSCGNLLEDIQLFDVYKGEQIGAGKKSVAFNITLRCAEYTLKDDQVNDIMQNVISNLETLGAKLR